MGGARQLLFVKQFLEQLFARAQAGEHDLDVAARLAARQPDHLLRQIGDLDRLTHVQHEDLAALAHRTRLQDQLAGLGDGHEVADHLRVRDGDRAAGADLLAEQRYHAARRPQHVAEAHGYEARLRTAVEILAEDLGDALAGAHHVRGVDGLVGGDHDEGLDAVAVGGQRQRARAQHIVARRLADLMLQHRHVLVGRRMEDHLRPVLREHPVDQHRIGDVAETHLQRQLRTGLAQLALDLEQVELALLEQHQRLRSDARHLSAELRTDRAAAAGHQHALALQLGTDALPVQRHRLPSQQIVDADVAQRIDRHAAGDQILEARHRTERHTGLFAEADDALHVRTVRRRDRQDDHVDLVAFDQFGDLSAHTQHAHALNVHADLVRLVVDEAHRDQRARRIAGHVPHQHVTGPARADDEHALAFADVQAPVLDPAIEHARKTEQTDQQHRIQWIHRPRYALEPGGHQHDHQDGDRTDDDGLDDADQIRQRGEAPVAAIELEIPERRGLHAHHQRQPGHGRLEKKVGNRAEVEAQPVRPEPRERNHREVVQEDDRGIAQAPIGKELSHLSQKACWPRKHTEQHGQDPRMATKSTKPAKEMTAGKTDRRAH